MGDVRFIYSKFYLSLPYFEKQITQFQDILFLASSTFLVLRCRERNVKYQLVQCSVVVWVKHVVSMFG